MKDLTETKELPWFTALDATFGANLPINDFVHLEVPPTPYSISETYWFHAGDPNSGFAIDFYTVMRRNLNVALTGVWAYRGMTREHPMTILHYNVQTALPLTISKATKFRHLFLALNLKFSNLFGKPKCAIPQLAAR